MAEQKGSAAKAPQQAQPQQPQQPQQEADPRDALIASLKARLQAREAEAPRQTQAPAPGTYRVTLPGAPVRVVDDQGRAQMQDHLDVRATSPGDAFETFKRLNGIISTTQVPRIELVTKE